MRGSTEVNHTAAEAASLLGVSVRALRVYERHGLVKPKRTAAGWRIYDPEAIHELHQVLALKDIGLPLAQIAKLVRGNTASLDRILALQEMELKKRKQRVERALTLVRNARKKLADGKELPLEALVALIKETRMRYFEPTPEFRALWARHLSEDQMTREHRARYTEQWLALIDEAERLKDSDPGSEPALDLVRRARAFVAELTGGNPELIRGLEAMFQEGFSDPNIAGRMPYSLDVWHFMNAAQERLRAAEA